MRAHSHCKENTSTGLVLAHEPQGVAWEKRETAACADHEPVLDVPDMTGSATEPHLLVLYRVLLQKLLLFGRSTDIYPATLVLVLGFAGPLGAKTKHTDKLWRRMPPRDDADNESTQHA